MSGYQGTFQRYEIKYLIEEEKFNLLMENLQGKLLIDDYGRITICNIYYDTPDYRIIQRSMEKPVYKEKLRLRSYGMPKDGDKVFVELKKKYQGIVYKRREKMELSEAEQYLLRNSPPSKQTQITKEVDWFLKAYQEIEPAMFISYSRIAMYDSNQPGLRITFDTNIFWRDKDLNLRSGVYGNPILEEGQQLMEIKIPGAMPLWLSHLLDQLEIYPTSFSKYGRGYQQMINQNKQEDKKEKKYA